jgi:Primase C terminal 2 (PriCT-2)/Bifunctional DNA primase/polymerase, N-terminal
MTDSLIGQYRALEWALIPIPEGSKAPVAKHWDTRQFAPADFPPGCNVGVIWGPRSHDTVDADLDCHEAIDLAPIYLPPTGATFGRVSKPDSHWLYEAPGALFDHWTDPLSKSTLLELRAPGKEGRCHQTIIPPSIADGERREWSGNEIKPAAVNAASLRRRCIWLAIGALIRRYVSVYASERPGHDMPRLLWEFDHDLGRAAYHWLGKKTPDEPRQYPRPRFKQDPSDLDLAEIVKAIPNNYDWEDWNRIGLAIFAASKDHGDGFVIFDDFSAKSPKYDPAQTVARWLNYRKSPPSATGIGKLAKLAYQAGWRPQAGAPQ